MPRKVREAAGECSVDFMFASPCRGQGLTVRRIESLYRVVLKE